VTLLYQLLHDAAAAPRVGVRLFEYPSLTTFYHLVKIFTEGKENT